MTQEQPYNALPEGFEGEKRRKTEFGSAEEKSGYDADGLIALAKKTYSKKIVTANEAFDLRSREDDNPEDLRRAVAMKLKNPEFVEIDERLQSLVVEPINALSEAQRTVKGRLRSGEEIARAIPDVATFLNEVDLQKQDGVLLDFFELNEEGQLVMKDNCPEAYGLGENALQARMRQTRIVYKEDGQTKVITGEEYFNVTKQDEESRPLEMELSEAAKKIDPRLILMARGLPTLKWDGSKHIGEYVRMNTGQLERSKITWTDDDSLDASRARYAYWSDDYGIVYSGAYNSRNQRANLGSRGVLRVNLNFES
jgi:hypothetical protein